MVGESPYGGATSSAVVTYEPGIVSACLVGKCPFNKSVYQSRANFFQHKLTNSLLCLKPLVLVFLALSFSNR